MAGFKLQGATPYLYYEDAGAAVDWMVSVLGFARGPHYVNDKGIVAEAEAWAGDQPLWLSGHGPGYWQAKGHGAEGLIIVWVDDVDAHFAAAVAAGAEAEAPVDKPYGVRAYSLTDPEGYRWSIMQRLGTPVKLAPGWQEVQVSP
jgi:uncharacterized glyoxalase superfamily protein PhnB